MKKNIIEKVQQISTNDSIERLSTSFFIKSKLEPNLQLFKGIKKFIHCKQAIGDENYSIFY